MFRQRTTKERVAALRKRLEFLTARINSTDKDLSYDKQECDALEWALPIIEQHVAVEAYKRHRREKLITARNPSDSECATTRLEEPVRGDNGNLETVREEDSYRDAQLRFGHRPDPERQP